MFVHFKNQNCKLEICAGIARAGMQCRLVTHRDRKSQDHQTSACFLRVDLCFVHVIMVLMVGIIITLVVLTISTTTLVAYYSGCMGFVTLVKNRSLCDVCNRLQCREQGPY